MACGDVKSQVTYLKRLALYRKEKPFQLFVPIEPDNPDQRASNLVFEPKECTFLDIRKQISDCSLDVDGVQLQVFPTDIRLESFQNRSIVESHYFAEVEQILHNIEGGYDRVFFFDWRVSGHDSPQRRKDTESRIAARLHQTKVRR